MKKRVLLGIVAGVSLVTLSGCGNSQKLTCTQTQEDDGATATQEMVVEFQDNEASAFTMTMNMVAENASAEDLKTAEEMLKLSFSAFEENGMNVDVSSDDTSVTAKVSADFSQMTDEEKEQIGFTGSDNSYETIKESFEREGYTCK